MANEITTRTVLTIIKGALNLNLEQVVSETLTGTGAFTTVQLIGTSTEQIVFPADIVTEGIKRIWLKNLGLVNGTISDTNYIQIGLNTPVTQIFARLYPEKMALQVPTDNAVTVDPTWYAKANGAETLLEIGAGGT